METGKNGRAKNRNRPVFSGNIAKFQTIFDVFHCAIRSSYCETYIGGFPSRNKGCPLRAAAALPELHKKIDQSDPSQDCAVVWDQTKFFGSIVPNRFT
jgi:hypothetical protein